MFAVLPMLTTRCDRGQRALRTQNLVGKTKLAVRSEVHGGPQLGRGDRDFLPGRAFGARGVVRTTVGKLEGIGRHEPALGASASAPTG